MSTKIEAATESGTEVSIPLAKLKKSPRNARKTPHVFRRASLTPLSRVR
jgi:hypothetical protein